MSLVRQAVIVTTGFAMLAAPVWGNGPRIAQGAVTRGEVERAIREGVRYLKSVQRDEGSWVDIDQEARTGTTSLVTLALLTSGEQARSQTIQKALAYLRRFGPDDLKSTYAVSLQTMVYAAAEPTQDRARLATNVAWLSKTQIKSGDPVDWPGSWSYSALKTRNGDNSNSQYALLGLNAASEAGIAIPPDVWKLAREYWERGQNAGGGWAYTPESRSPVSGSMTCAGISSLILTGLRRIEGAETLLGNEIKHCGETGVNSSLTRGVQWLSEHFRVGENVGFGQQWRYYYLYGMERAGRLTGLRFFGRHDWYREGAEKLVHDQDLVQGFWKGTSTEESPTIATSFALLFLAKGRAPVLINKLRHGPGEDWNNDQDDVRNLVDVVSRDWRKMLDGQILTWQVVDPREASVEDLLQAPIAFMNGHEAPELGPDARRNLRSFIEQGGILVGEACCGEKAFDHGFRELMKEIFSEEGAQLHLLPEGHAIWRSRHTLNPEAHPLWGIEYGCRTVVIYSPQDLSCYWNLAESNPSHPGVLKAIRVGQNVVEYATGRELPADKLVAREVRVFQPERPKRGALQIAKLVHAGDWNVAPLAVPNLTTTLRQKAGLDVVVTHKQLFPNDPNIVNFPLIYLHGRAAFSYSQEELGAIRRHLEPGGGTLFADAACGSPSFDTSFRRFVSQLFPGGELVEIPRDDEIYTSRVGYDLTDVELSRAAGGTKGRPRLEGVKIDGHWAIIYSRFDLGCALERHQSLDCKGYLHESALRIATNIVLYSTLP